MQGVKNEALYFLDGFVLKIKDCVTVNSLFRPSGRLSISSTPEGDLLEKVGLSERGKAK